jgi:hypothetical protein
VIDVNPVPRLDPLPAKDFPQRGADEREALLHAVVESRTFAKSKRLAQFFKFFRTLTIGGEAR